MSSYPPPGPPAPPGAVPPGPSFPAGPPGPAAEVDVAADPLVTRSLSEWVSGVVGVVTRSWRSLVLIQLATGLATTLLTFVVLLAAGLGAVMGSTTTALSGAIVAVLVVVVVAVVIGAIGQAASLYVAVRDADGRPAPLGEAFSFAARRALPLIGWGLLVGILLAAGAVAFVLPAVYLLVVFVPTYLGVVALERQGIGRMFALAHRNLGATAGRVLLFVLGAGVYSVLVDLLIGALTTHGSLADSVLNGVLIQLPVGLVGLAVSVVTYAGLRHDEDAGVGTSALAAELQR